MKLKEFLQKFVEPNTLIRLWYPTENGTRTPVMQDGDKDIVDMEWRIIREEGVYKYYANNKVRGVTDILVRGHYVEAVNIVIEA